MGWEERNGNTYYYRKCREGDRVVSEYVGRGELAAMIARWEYQNRLQQNEERVEERRNLEALEEQRKQVYRVLDQIQDLTHATLLVNGYHTHKGQWRKCHGSNTTG